jgi:hypothetical protein
MTHALGANSASYRLPGLDPGSRFFGTEKAKGEQNGAITWL